MTKYPVNEDTRAPRLDVPPWFRTLAQLQPPLGAPARPPTFCFSYQSSSSPARLPPLPSSSSTCATASSLFWASTGAALRCSWTAQSPLNRSAPVLVVPEQGPSKFRSKHTLLPTPLQVRSPSAILARTSRCRVENARGDGKYV